MGMAASATGAVAADAVKPASASLLGGALPGGAIISARSVAVASVAGGAIVAAPIASDGTFRLEGLAPGRYRLAVTSTSVPKQTQGATFGEKVNAGLATTGSAVASGASATRHDTAKNSIGNIRAAEPASPAPAADSSSAPQAAINNINGGMPNRISMNVTVAKQAFVLEVDGAPVEIEVDAGGVLSGRVAAR